MGKNNTIHINRHPYHLVTESLWPFFVSVASLSLPVNAVLYFHGYKGALFLLIFSLIILIFFMSLWWRDVIREGTYLGDHTKVVQKGLCLGMILFIISEIMFFASFFGAFLYCAWVPNVEIAIWPPLGINPPNPFGIPLLNTVVLLWSGLSISLAHSAMIFKYYNIASKGMIFTIVLAIIFTVLQFFEYKYSSVTIADGIYGSTFYMTTGFHGLHVIIGTIFISVCLYRNYLGEFWYKNHLGFLFASWYWHFVDFVWLFLYVIFYIWGSIYREAYIFTPEYFEEFTQLKYFKLPISWYPYWIPFSFWHFPHNIDVALFSTDFD